jgi:nickel superoxide dismutase
MRGIFFLSVLLLGSLGFTAAASAHCQVPCGIYDDAARIKSMHEDATTITKANTMIGELSGKQDGKSINQMTRWIQTKEQHASKIIQTVSEYFLTQKLKPAKPGSKGYSAYLSRLADHHMVLVWAMKTKQGVSTETAAKLHEAIAQMASHWSKK